MNEKGYFEYSRDEMKSHQCTAAELGLAGSEDSKFWPQNKNIGRIIIPERF